MAGAVRGPHRHNPHRIPGKWYLGQLWFRDPEDPSSPFVGDADALMAILRDYHDRNGTGATTRKITDSEIALHYPATGNTYTYRSYDDRGRTPR